jgi:hypothetical protein
LIPWRKEPVDNSGANWNTGEIFTKLELSLDISENITFEEEDTDNDALNNIEECYTDKYDSDPFFKDIFIEIDWLENPDDSNKLSNEFIKKAVTIFQDHDINLHIDVGNLDGGEEIPIQSLSSCVEVRDIYWDYFLNNDLDNPRKGIFRYCLIMNDNEEIWGGFVFVGWDHLDTIGICIQRLQNNNKLLDKDQLIIGGIMHELGHLCGLLIDDHGGIDNTGTANFLTMLGWKSKNYWSCMNYRYVYHILQYSDGTHGKGDFDDWSNLDLNYFKNTCFGSSG